jgi:hypothetical protein
MRPRLCSTAKQSPPASRAWRTSPVPGLDRPVRPRLLQDLRRQALDVVADLDLYQKLVGSARSTPRRPSIRQLRTSGLLAAIAGWSRSFTVTLPAGSSIASSCRREPARPRALVAGPVDERFDPEVLARQKPIGQIAILTFATKWRSDQPRSEAPRAGAGNHAFDVPRTSHGSYRFRKLYVGDMIRGCRPQHAIRRYQQWFDESVRCRILLWAARSSIQVVPTAASTRHCSSSTSSKPTRSFRFRSVSPLTM